jgi:hypothetical protein
MKASPQRRAEMTARRQDQRTRTPGFTQSPTAAQIEGVPVSRGFLRLHNKLTRRKSAPTVADKHAEAKASGLIKIRDFHMRAGIRVLPFSGTEMKEMLIEAKEEFEHDGVLSMSTEAKLGAVGYDVAQITQLWRLMAKAGIDMDGVEDASYDEPLNRFGEGEEI